MSRIDCLPSALFLLSSLSCAMATAAAPPEEADWGKEPIVATSARRGEACLNGLWRFMPARGPAARQPAGDWGYARVPGDWRNTPARPGIARQGTGPAWADLKTSELPLAWYERTFQVPREWAGRSIMIDFRRVSTDAAIFVNGKRCGEIHWPSGSVEITSAVVPGQTATVRALVAATSNEREGSDFLASLNLDALKTTSSLESRGIIGDVILRSRPTGPHIRDVFVQTSVREKFVYVDVELTGIKTAGVAQVHVRMLDESGREEQRFSRIVGIEKKDTQTVTAAWRWENPRLWDLARPQMYTALVEVRGVDVDDAWAQPFGFREFWVEGKSFFLNGTEIRLRPNIGLEQWSNVAGTIEVIDGVIDGQRKAGFNIEEHWPIDINRRGTPNYREIRADRADRKGWLIMGGLVNVVPYLIDGSGKVVWREGDNAKKWEAAMFADMKRLRNHPSIVMWSTSANYFGFAQDQNPVLLGNKDWKPPAEPTARLWRYAGEAIATAKTHDPTRPIFNHQGGFVGDLQAVNMYLNLLPLQDREEWLSHWAAQGKMPFMAVEFGTPLHTTFLRGRADFPDAVLTEPLMTEFAAIYLGRDAYTTEPKAYRDEIRNRFVKDQSYRNWQGVRALETAPAFQQIQALFTRNTWRSWRTWGVTGGMVPWSHHGWSAGPAYNETVSLSPPQSGRQGTWTEKVLARELNYLQPPAWKIEPGGEALIANNADTLAWIAGPPDAFTAKDHSFEPGASIARQAVLINDGRSPVDFSFTWEATIAGRTIERGEQAGRIDAARTLFFPIGFTAPRDVPGKGEGEIRLTATIGAHRHEDRFAFRIFPLELRRRQVFTLFDPEKKTRAMLEQQGHGIREWKGEMDAPMLLIGWKALSRNHKLPASLETYVKGGGRAVVFAQSRDWMHDQLGLRYAEHLSRRVFPIDPSHPAVAGLDAIDLRDWTGASTLVDPKPDLMKPGATLATSGTPYYGWRWGSRGAVTSAAIEKPHRSGWRPILECEFDLAYTPLMELDYGAGRLIWCTLDLEDHVAADPAAARLLQQLLAYAQSAPLRPRAASVALIGDEADAAWLDAVGIRHTRADALAPSINLAIVGASASIAPDALSAYLSAGGKAFFLPRKTSSDFVQVAPAPSFAGSLDVPVWPECAGLSPSDLRWRTDAEAILIRAGGEIGAGGLLARRAAGRGVALFCQIDPLALSADQRTYFRYTRWRQTRAIAQVLANLGATFTADDRIFRPTPLPPSQINLAGDWRVKLVRKASGPDTGFSDEARALVRPELNHSAWEKAKFPGIWAGFKGNIDGEAIFRRSFELPPALAGQQAELSLGPIDDYDETFVNGHRVGGMSAKDPEPWRTPRVYMVPKGVLRAGRNIVAVRNWDQGGDGGFTGKPEDLVLRFKVGQASNGFYHPDYRTDFPLGDDPYRYFRW